MNTVKMMAVGDIFLKTKNNKLPFENVKEILKDKDILFGNLETVLSNQGKETEKAVSLHTSPDKVSYLKDAAFDILNVANNHIMDLGIEGFNETLNILAKNNINFIGARNNAEQDHNIILEKQGIKLGFLGYSNSGLVLPEKNIWINKIELKTIIKDIEFIKQKCDFVIVSLHWGIENVFYPSPQQIEFAHKLVDAGSTIILGHHPHVIQGIERYKHGLIAYSLGNFQFDPYVSNSPNNQSFILTIELTKNELESYNINPVKIDRDFVPYLVMGEEKTEILEFISKISDPIVKKQLNENKWFEEISEEYLYGNIKSWFVRIKKYGIKHFLQFIRWLISPFCLKCYAAILRQKFKKLVEKV